jgi:hypothetical protein
MSRRAAITAALIIGAATASCGNSEKEVAVALTPQPSASRAPAPRVAPVFIAGVRYAQVAGDRDTDGQVGGMLAAYDASNRELWRLKVYVNARRPDLEGDVQDVWFRSLRVQGERLLIENERGEQFEVDPAARRVLASHAPAAHPSAGVRGMVLMSRTALKVTRQ